MYFPQVLKPRAILFDLGDTLIHFSTTDQFMFVREGTRLAILQYPTGSRDRPLTDRLSGGRFLLLAPGYLETAVYRPGRAITVVGEVRGQQVLPLDDTTYRYPLLVPRELYLWREGYDIPRFHIGFGLGFSTGF